MNEGDALAARVRAIRELRKLTQAELAVRARMARTDINKLENGKLPLGDARLARVAAALEVSVLELRPEAEPDEPGLALRDRLEALEARTEQVQRERVRAIRAVTRRLADLEDRLELLEQRLAPPSTENAPH